MKIYYALLYILLVSLFLRVINEAAEAMSLSLYTLII